MSHRPTPRFLWTLAGCGLLAILLLVQVAFADPGPGVYYSQETVQIGDTSQEMLVPKTLRSRMADDLETNVRAAFKALQLSKRPQYGRSSLKIDPGKLKKGKLTVEVDPGKLEFLPLIEAEVLATFATLGLDEVEFKADKITHKLRTDTNSVPVFSLILPISSALPPARIPGARVQMTDGSLMGVDEFQSQLKGGDSKLARAVLDALENGAPTTQINLVSKIGSLKLSNWEDSAVKLLKSKDPSVQIAAAAAFEKSSDRKVLDALKALVDDKKADPKAQAAAAAALSTSPDNKYNSYGAIFALRGADANAAVTAIESIVASSAKSASPDLVKAMSSPHASVARRAATALRELGEDDALASALSDTKIPEAIREHAATELTRTSTPEKGHMYLAASGSPRPALAAIEALAKNRDLEEASKTVAKGLENPHSRVRRASALKLVTFKVDDRTKEMSDAADAHPEDASVIHNAMVDLLVAAKRPDDLKDRLKLRATTRERRALFHAIGRETASNANMFNRFRDELTEGINKQKDPLVRGGAILGLSEGKNTDDLALIAGLAKDSDGGIREDVARALAQYPAGTATDVLQSLLEDSEPTVVVAAVEAFGQRKEEAMLKDLIKLHDKAADPVKIALYPVAVTLVTSKPGVKASVYALLTKGTFDKEKAVVRLAAIETIGATEDEDALEALVPLVADTDPTIRLAVFDALATSQTDRAGKLLAQGLDSKDTATRLAAVNAIEAHGGALNKAKLETLAKGDPDAEVKARAAAVAKTLK